LELYRCSCFIRLVIPPPCATGSKKSTNSRPVQGSCHISDRGGLRGYREDELFDVFAAESCGFDEDDFFVPESVAFEVPFCELALVEEGLAAELLLLPAVDF